jgi:type I restriction enzyme, R subunit
VIALLRNPHLQAIARVNRPYEDSDGRSKPAGFVLDFVGVFEKLEKALAFDSKDVSGVIEGIDVLQRHFALQMATARDDYFPLTVAKVGDKAVEAVMEFFRDGEPRQAFYRFFEDVQETYEILSPDKFLRPYLDDYNRLVEMYQICRATYDRDVDIERTLLRKTGHLVAQYTESGGVKAPDAVFEITDAALSKLTEGDAPSTVKVINLLKTIEAMVKRDATVQPFLISIGERAETIAQAFEERQVEAEQALQELLGLAEEAQSGKTAQTALGLTPDAFAVYWYLKGKGLTDADAKHLAEGAMTAFGDSPYWRSSPDHERKVRSRLYALVIAAGHRDKSTEFVKDLLDQLERVH